MIEDNENPLVTPELLEAIEKERIVQANRIKEANLQAKAIKIMCLLPPLVSATSTYSRTEIIKKINKECSKYLKEQALW